MKRIPLGRSSLQVSPIAMGCWQLVGSQQWGSQEESNSRAAVHAALDTGINLFDTAPIYGDGQSEEVLGRALQGRRDRAVVATKVSASELGREALKASCEASLRRLRTDRIDLLQIHWGSRTIPLSETVAAFEELIGEGKILACGSCNFDVTGMRAAREAGAHFAVQQLPYSLLWRAIEHGILPECDASSISVLAYSPLMQGLLAGSFRDADEVPPPRRRTRHFRGDRPEARHEEPGREAETFAALARIEAVSKDLGQPMGRVALAWLLHRPAVASVLAGARSPRQVHENASAIDLNLPADALAALDEATLPLREQLGPNPDMWETPSRFL